MFGAASLGVTIYFGIKSLPLEERNAYYDNLLHLAARKNWG